MAFKITLSYLGLVTFPAKLDKATETPVEMKNLCVGSNGKPAHDPTPLTAPRCCTTCGEITDYAGVKKGIKSGTTYALVEQEDVAEARIDNAAAYKGVVNLVPHPTADFEAHTAPGKSINYITVDAASADHYQLLVSLIQARPDLTFVTLYTPRTAAGLYRVVVRNGVLVMEERTRGQALKAAPSVGGTANPALLPMMEAALTAFIQPYDPDAYADNYRKALEDLAAKATDVVDLGTGTKATPTATVTPINDTDLMAKLAALAAA